MPIINLKLYIYAALFVGFIAFVLRYDYLSEKVDSQAKEIEQYAKSAAEQERILSGTEQARTEAKNQLEAAKDEIKKRDDCIASGDCKRVVRIKSACSVPQASLTSGAEEGYAELATSVQRAATDFEYRLAEQEHKLNLCLKYARLVSEDK